MPIKAKFHMEPQWDGGTKVCSNDPGHMTKMAATPIYGNILQLSSSPEPKGQWYWGLVCIIWGLGPNKVYSLVNLGLTLSCVTSKSNLLPYVSVRENLHFFRENVRNLQQITREIRGLCLYQNFVPKGLSAFAPELYTCIKAWKKYE